MFDYSGDDTVREFSSCAFNPSGETAVFGTYNRFYIFTLNAKRTWEEVGAEPPGGGGGGGGLMGSGGRGCPAGLMGSGVLLCGGDQKGRGWGAMLGLPGSSMGWSEGGGEG